MMDVTKAFIVGVVTIGIITALMSNGRQTANVLKAGFGGASQLLNTAEKG